MIINDIQLQILLDLAPCLECADIHFFQNEGKEAFSIHAFFEDHVFIVLIDGDGNVTFRNFK